MMNTTFTDAFGLQHGFKPLSEEEHKALAEERIESERMGKEVSKWLKEIGVLIENK